MTLFPILIINDIIELVNDMNKEKILDMISTLIFIVGVILFIVYKNNMLVALTIAGVVGLLFGIIAFIKKEGYSVYLTAVSVVLIVTLILYSTKLLSRGNAITFMLLGSFVCLMIMSAIVTFVSRRYFLKKYSVVVEGVVSDLKKNPNTKKEIYNVVYDYDIDGKGYTAIDPYAVEKKTPNIGDVKKIYVDPNDYSEVWFDISKNKLIKEYILEFVSALIGIIILVTLFI